MTQLSRSLLFTITSIPGLPGTQAVVCDRENASSMQHITMCEEPRGTVTACVCVCVRGPARVPETRVHASPPPAGQGGGRPRPGQLAQVAAPEL